VIALLPARRDIGQATYCPLRGLHKSPVGRLEALGPHLYNAAALLTGDGFYEQNEGSAPPHAGF
jgi:hypothetical protein